jgi:acetyltransferase-like isoleucine patch superfamily enzyme
MGLLKYLWSTRDRPTVGSVEWFRAWAKRLLLLRQLFAQGVVARRGAKVGELCFFSDPDGITGDLSRFSVGDESFVGRVVIAVHAEVKIGSRVCINDGAKLLTASHEVADAHWRSFARPIVIEDYAWIATDALILPGVTIGRGAVVGAGAVVTQSVPAGAVAVGNPSKIMEGRRARDLDYSPVAHLALFTAWRKLKQP